MQSSLTPTNTFASKSGNVDASELDTNFKQPLDALNAYGTYNTYVVDTGAVNALAFTAASGLTLSLAAGLRLQILVAYTNTSTSVTLDANGTGAKDIVNVDGSAIQVGQIVAGGIATVQYDGTHWQLQTQGPVLVATDGSILKGLTEIADDAGNLQVAGYRGFPFNTQTAAYTLVLNDRGHGVHLNSGSTFAVTVPSGVFSAGDTVEIIASNGGTAYTIVEGSGLTMYLCGASGTTGTRTLTSVGFARIIFVASDSCYIGGFGLT